MVIFRSIDWLIDVMFIEFVTFNIFYGSVWVSWLFSWHLSFQDQCQTSRFRQGHQTVEGTWPRDCSSEWRSRRKLFPFRWGSSRNSFLFDLFFLTSMEICSHVYRLQWSVWLGLSESSSTPTYGRIWWWLDCRTRMSPSRLSTLRMRMLWKSFWSP